MKKITGDWKIIFSKGVKLNLLVINVTRIIRAFVTRVPSVLKLTSLSIIFLLKNFNFGLFLDYVRVKISTY